MGQYWYLFHRGFRLSWYLLYRRDITERGTYVVDWITRTQPRIWFTILSNTAVLKVLLLTGHNYFLRGMVAQ